jgi:DNA-binding Lrp family transcriptional regulator
MGLKEELMDAGHQKGRLEVIAELLKNDRYDLQEIARTVHLSKGEVLKIKRRLTRQKEPLHSPREMGLKEELMEAERREAIRKVVAELLRNGRFDLQEIARTIHFSEEEVLKIKRRLARQKEPLHSPHEMGLKEELMAIGYQDGYIEGYLKGRLEVIQEVIAELPKNNYYDPKEIARVVSLSKKEVLKIKRRLARQKKKFH